MVENVFIILMAFKLASGRADEDIIIVETICGSETLINCETGFTPTDPDTIDKLSWFKLTVPRGTADNLYISLWERVDGKQNINKEVRDRISAVNHTTLRINKTDFGDAGYYKCEAYNSGPPINILFRLVVNECTTPKTTTTDVPQNNTADGIEFSSPMSSPALPVLLALCTCGILVLALALVLDYKRHKKRKNKLPRDEPQITEATNTVVVIQNMRENHESNNQPASETTHLLNVDVDQVELQIERASGEERQKNRDENTNVKTANLRGDVATPEAAGSTNILKLMETEQAYRITKSTYGRAVIINNKHFINNEVRKGSEQDLEKLQELFGNFLKFQTKVYTDLSARDIISKIDIESKHRSLEQSEAFILVIMSHGKGTSITGSCGREVLLSDILSLIGGKNCCTLRGKPKLVFIQACQRQIRTVSERNGDAYQSMPVDLNPGSQRQQHEFSDMLIATATVPGYVSIRDIEAGSWFIQTLHQVFVERAKTEHVANMLTEVNNRVSQLYDETLGPGIVQQPEYRSSLRKKLYFPPREDVA